MKSKFLISVKSSGLCFNIMRLIILTKLAKEFDRKIIFLTKPDHISILKKFNPDCLFIPYVTDHTTKFNNYKRNKSIHKLYDLKYIKFLIENYFKKLFENVNVNDFKLINGSKQDISDKLCKFLLIDYNDGLTDAENINSIKIEPIKFKADKVYNKDITSINIKINNPNSKRIYDFWDEIIPKLKTKYKDILLISGNNEIKKYLSEKYNCLYYNTDTEVNYSNVRGNNIVRGKPEIIMQDILTCTTTNFLPFTKLKEDYPYILERYKDLNFVVEKEEKFDIVVEYLSKYIILES